MAHRPKIVRVICGYSLLMLMLTLAACESQTKTSDLDVQTIQVGQLRQMLAGEGDWEGKGPTALIDVRSRSEYEKGHIPGAMNVPVSDVKASDQRLSAFENVVVYGSGWSDYLSRAASKKLAALGYSNVFDFCGGLELWATQGRVLEGP